MPTSIGHEWTTFELQTMLALMARGVHLGTALSHPPEPNPKSKSKSKSKSRSSSYSYSDNHRAKTNAYLNFATELNYALHKTDYAQDISKREVTKMLDKMLVDRKAVVGKGGLMERQGTQRLTRRLRMAWECNRKGGFDGSLSEWNLWRRERVMGRKEKTENDNMNEERPVGAEIMTPPPSTGKNRVYKRPGRSSAVTGSMFKSAARVAGSDDEVSDDETPALQQEMSRYGEQSDVVLNTVSSTPHRPSTEEGIMTPPVEGHVSPNKLGDAELAQSTDDGAASTKEVDMVDVDENNDDEAAAMQLEMEMALQDSIYKIS